MPKRQPQLAKLTRPRLHKAVARERLFVLLDEAREYKPAICVVGPPGAGKTTLVASWLDSRSIKGIWFQVDPGDADLATFFYYLGEAARPFTRKGQQPLPLLTPEYGQDIEGFSRRFFRDLFSRLPEGSGLILDNYQEVPAGSPFHSLITMAVDQLPSGLTILVVSRSDPPDCYARLIANSRVRLVEWDDLRFTLQETATLALSKALVPPESLRRIHELSDGWAAGLTLLLNDQSSSGGAPAGSAPGGKALFAYFAEQSFAQLPSSTQTFLVTTAFLAQVPLSLAAELTKNLDTGAILQDLYERHLFTHRRNGEEPIYWYHALFREFLQSRAPDILGHEAIRMVRRQAAHLLEQRGVVDEVFPLYAESEDWDAAARLTEAAASRLLARGRGQTLRDWISGLPVSMLAERAWLRYWLGISLIQIDPREARYHLEAATERFTRQDDLHGQALAAAAVIDSYFYDWSDFRPVRAWVNILETLVEKTDFAGQPDIARRLHSSLLVGMLYAAPGHTMLPRAVEQVSFFLDEDLDANDKIATGIILLSYCNLASNMDLGRSVVGRCNSLVKVPELTPLNQLWWHLRLGYHHELSGNYQAARDALDCAIELCESHGFRGIKGTFLLIASYQISTAASEGNIADVRAWYQRMVAMSDPARPMDAWHLAESKAHVDALMRNLRAVAEVSERTLQLVAVTSMTYLEVLCLVNLAIARAVLGESNGFVISITRLRKLIAGTCFAYFECAADLLEAYLLLRSGEPRQGQEALAAALQSARSRQFTYPQTMRLTSIVGSLFSEALRSGIETDYVEETVRRLGIPAPADAHAFWPWPLKVHALGGFDIDCHGARLKFSGKTPKKPLALLKCLIAFGGRNVPEYRIVDSLWPGEDADLAIKALDVTLVRLKKLLDEPQAIVAGDGVLSLNPKLFWTDIWAFEKAEERALQSDDTVRNDSLRDAMNLYRGELLPADAELAWTLKAREGLRSRFLQLVAIAAERHENAGRWESAIACYERGLRADDLAEPLYQGLMRCYRALGRHAQAMGAYRKLRQLLSVVLGMAPSEDTQALARVMQEERPAQP